jgi:hypothetical protein
MPKQSNWQQNTLEFLILSNDFCFSLRPLRLCGEIPPTPFTEGGAIHSLPFDIPLRGMKAMVKYHKLRVTELFYPLRYFTGSATPASLNPLNRN